jgi:elongation factor G
MYAHVQVTVRALERGRGIVFAWNAGSNIPVKFATAVLEGIHKAASAGVSEKFELSDIHISVDDGSYHDVDSTLDAFREAAGKAAIEAVRRAGSIVLEAMSLVTILVPLQFVDSIESVVKSHGGQAQITGSETIDRTLEATVPASKVNSMVIEVLEVSDGGASVSIAGAGFRPRPEPPDTVEQWVLRS